MKLVEDEVAIGSKLEVVGRASHQLLATMGVVPRKIVRV